MSTLKYIECWDLSVGFRVTTLSKQSATLKISFMKIDLEKITKFVVALGTLLTAATNLYREYNKQQQKKT